MMGGGGGGGGSAPQNFLPPGQGAVAGQLPGLIDPMRRQGENALSQIGDISPAGLAYPNVLSTTSNILGNPYADAAVRGGGYSQNIYENQYLPAGFGGADQLASLSSIAQSGINPTFEAGFNPAYSDAADVGRKLSGGFQGAVGQFLGDIYAPQYQQAIGIGQQQSPLFQGATRQALGDVFAPQYLQAINYGLGDARQLHGAASSILDTSFDPQHALYNRTLQQVMDQQNAISSQSGIASTPYGAGVAGQRASDFNLDWQDRQLQRRISGGQAAGNLDLAGISAITNPSLAATQAAATDINSAATAGNSALSSILTPSLAATNAAATDLNSASNAMNSALGGFLTPANNRIAAALQGSGAFGNFANTANSNTTGGLGILRNLAGDAPGMVGAPYNSYNAVQGNNFGALQNEINLGNANYALPEQVIGDLMQYLGLGQRASSIGAQIAGTNNQIGQTNFGQLASGAQGASSLLFGNSGPFGSGGLLGGLGGGGSFGTAAANTGPFALGGGGELGAATEIGSVADFAAPLAFSA